VQREIDGCVVGSNATPRGYHCQPKSSEDGVTQCEPSRGLFRGFLYGGSGHAKMSDQNVAGRTLTSRLNLGYCTLVPSKLNIVENKRFPETLIFGG